MLSASINESDNKFLLKIKINLDALGSSIDILIAGLGVLMGFDSTGVTGDIYLLSISD